MFYFLVNLLNKTFILHTIEILSIHDLEKKGIKMTSLTRSNTSKKEEMLDVIARLCSEKWF